jgi:transcriptional regulator with XRE-family HTH domain
MPKKKSKESAKLNRLQLILWDKDLSQKKFAEMAKVDPNSISRMCTNKTQPSLKLLFKMAHVLKVEPAELLTSISSIEASFFKD